MKRIESPWDLPESRLNRALAADREVRISDLILFAVIPFRALEAAGLPINELACLALVGLALLRTPTSRELPPVVTGLLALMLGILVFSGMANGVDWTRRVIHMAIFAGLVWALGTGRVSLRSAALGMGAGVIVVSGLALAGIGGDNYPGRLTGYLADPNAGAYFLVVLGVLAVAGADTDWRRKAVVAVPMMGAVVLTYSRTGLLAMAFVLVWWLLGRRLGRVGGVVMVAALVWVVENIPGSLQQWGPFSNRSGSDALRDRIVREEQISIATMPWYGHGPGTARVRLDEQEFFFHNSYLATRQEGGWILLLTILALVAVAFLALFHQSHAADLGASLIQGALIAVVVMATTLGEVLMELPAAIAIGFALGYARRRRVPGIDPDPPPWAPTTTQPDAGPERGAHA